MVPNVLAEPAWVLAVADLQRAWSAGAVLLRVGPNAELPAETDAVTIQLHRAHLTL